MKCVLHFPLQLFFHISDEQNAALQILQRGPQSNFRNAQKDIHHIQRVIFLYSFIQEYLATRYNMANSPPPPHLTHRLYTRFNSKRSMMRSQHRHVATCIM